MSNLPSPKIQPLLFSQQLVTRITKMLKEHAPNAYSQVDWMLEQIDDNLQATVQVISVLETTIEYNKDLLSDCEDLADELMDGLKDLEKYDPELRGLTIAGIAKELYSQAEDIYDTASQGGDL